MQSRTLLCLAALVAAVVTGCSAPLPANGDVAASANDVPARDAAPDGDTKKKTDVGSAHTARAGTGRSQRDGEEVQASTPTKPATRARTFDRLLVHVDDSPADREGASRTPAYIEITGSTVTARDGNLAMTIETAAPIARQASNEDVAIFAFEVDTSTASWSVIGQTTDEGISGELRSEDSAHEVDVRTRGNSITLEFPWRLIGAGEPFSWTASTAHLTFEAQVPTANGGDSAPVNPADFPS